MIYNFVIHIIDPGNSHRQLGNRMNRDLQIHAMDRWNTKQWIKKRESPRERDYRVVVLRCLLIKTVSL